MTKEELEKKYGVTTEGYPKEMMCWDFDIKDASKSLVLCKKRDVLFPYITSDGIGFSFAEDIENIEDIEETEKPIRKIEDGLEYGDIITDTINYAKVLGVAGDIVFLSSPLDFNLYCGTVYTLGQIVESGLKLKTENND